MAAHCSYGGHCEQRHTRLRSPCGAPCGPCVSWRTRISLRLSGLRLRDRGLFLFDANLAQEVFDLFFGQDARRDPVSLADDLFVAAGGTAAGADDQVVAFRLRDADERQAALAALDRKKVFLDGHRQSPAAATLLTDG